MYLRQDVSIGETADCGILTHLCLPSWRFLTVRLTVKYTVAFEKGLHGLLCQNLDF